MFELLSINLGEESLAPRQASPGLIDALESQNLDDIVQRTVSSELRPLNKAERLPGSNVFIGVLFWSAHTCAEPLHNIAVGENNYGGGA